MVATIRTKRVYDAPEDQDGYRVLVDRLWPRGLTKESAKVDLWMKEIAPSPALRKWFSHDPGKWKTFSEKYTAELKQSPAIEEMRVLMKKNKTISLLYGARDNEHTHALILKKHLETYNKNKHP